MSILEIDQTLVLSTAHVSPATRAALDAGGADDSDNTVPLTLPWQDYGWIVWVDADWARLTAPTDARADLAAVLGLARDNGCQWVRLDCDGPIVAGLPTYEDAPILCPKCGGATHQCATGDPGCRHCNADACDHSFQINPRNTP